MACSLSHKRWVVALLMIHLFSNLLGFSTVLNGLELFETGYLSYLSSCAWNIAGAHCVCWLDEPVLEWNFSCQSLKESYPSNTVLYQLQRIMLCPWKYWQCIFNVLQSTFYKLRVVMGNITKRQRISILLLIYLGLIPFY